jgi:hypothetical protein
LGLAPLILLFSGFFIIFADVGDSRAGSPKRHVQPIEETDVRMMDYHAGAQRHIELEWVLDVYKRQGPGRIYLADGMHRKAASAQKVHEADHALHQRRRPVSYILLAPGTFNAPECLRRDHQNPSCSFLIGNQKILLDQ